MLSVVRLYIFFQSVSRCPHVTQLTPGCYYCTQKSEALKRLVKEKKGKSVKKGRERKNGQTSEASLYLFHLLLRQMRFRLAVLAARIHPETQFMCFSLAAVGS